MWSAVITFRPPSLCASISFSHMYINLFFTNAWSFRIKLGRNTTVVGSPFFLGEITQIFLSKTTCGIKSLLDRVMSLLWPSKRYFLFLAHWTCYWFSTGTPVSSTNKTDCHDITEILLNTINLPTNQFYCVSNKPPQNMDGILEWGELLLYIQTRWVNLSLGFLQTYIFFCPFPKQLSFNHWR